ncbi:hypothetical protein C8R44DRAFT_390358 [Mycena epipterygia]|nr:hypothetical protein C8R44DRAFT_390358 [Mycena epipterygia]
MFVCRSLCMMFTGVGCSALVDLACTTRQARSTGSARISHPSPPCKLIHDIPSHMILQLLRIHRRALANITTREISSR